MMQPMKDVLRVPSPTALINQRHEGSNAMQVKGAEPNPWKGCTRIEKECPCMQPQDLTVSMRL